MYRFRTHTPLDGCDNAHVYIRTPWDNAYCGDMHTDVLCIVHATSKILQILQNFCRHIPSDF